LVGPVIKRKGPDIAVKIFKKLKRYDTDYKLILLGETESASNKDLFEENEEFFINESRRGNIIIPGLTDKVEEYLQLSDIFIFPTRKEGLGNAPLEAMACGLPVIANKLEGVTDYYVKDGKNGFLVSDNKYEDYVGHISNLMNDPSEYERISENAVRWIKKHISEDIVYQQYQDVYAKL
jgi:glycosyltransferase involved in cell wall biosynthesis